MRSRTNALFTVVAPRASVVLGWLASRASITGGSLITTMAGRRPFSEAGVSTFGAEEVQQFGLKRSAELLIGRAERIHWYSLYDLPRAWPACAVLCGRER